MKSQIGHARKWDIIAYVRLSDEDSCKEKEERSRSIENQRKYLESYISGMKERGEHVARYTVICDDGQTGTDIKRTGFQEALELLEKKKYNCLLVSDLSRGFRNIADQTYYLEEYFPLHDIRFISTTLQYVDNYLLTESAMNLGVKIQGITNEQFAYDTSVKIRSKFDMKRKMGEFIGAFAPFGYDKDPANNDLLIIDETAAVVIRDIFTWYVKEWMSLGAIVKKLNKLGIPNPTKYKNQKGQKLKNPLGNDGLWSASSVRRILTNEVYLGKMVQGREEVINYKVHKVRKIPRESWYVVEGTHEPIIDGKTFQEAQLLLNMNTRAGPKGQIYPLGGLLKCGECKKAMSRKSAKERTYYCCRTYREKGKEFCKPHSIREETLFCAVLDAVNLQLSQISNPAALIERARQSPPEQEHIDVLERQMSAFQKELESEMTVFEKSYYDFVEGLLSEEQFKRIQKRSGRRQNELKRLLKTLPKEKEEAKRKTKKSLGGLESFKKNKRVTMLTRGLAVELIEWVYVYSDQSVAVSFRFSDPYRP